MNEIITDANSPVYQLGLLKNIELNMTRARRKREKNVSIVMDYITARTSKGGMTSATIYCEWVGVDPDGYSFYN